MVEAKNLSELTLLAKQLNSESDSLNKSIATLNEKLAALNLGLSVWLDNSIESRDYVVEGENVTHTDYVTLGYCDVEGVWQLAVLYETRFYKDDYDTGTSEKYRIVPLLKVNREIRLQAAVQFDDLIELMKKTAEQMISNVRGARDSATAK